MVDILGYGMKYLFGTADARDVNVNQTIRRATVYFKAKMTHAVDHQLTYIRVLDESTRRNTMDIALLTETLRDSLYNFSLQLNIVEADLLDTQAALAKQVRYSAAIREIELALQDAITRHHRRD